MKLVIDTDAGRLMIAGPEGMRDLLLYSTEGLAALRELTDHVAQQQNGAAATPTQALTLVVVGTISPPLYTHLAKSARISLIVVGAELPPHEGLEPIRRISGDVIAAETQEQIRAAIPGDRNTLVALQLSTEKFRARQELEACAELVSVGSFLAVSGGETASVAADQIEQPAAVYDFAMDRSEFRLMKSPVADASGFWLQRVK